MYQVKDYYDAINRFAPFSTAESWDNVGLLVGAKDVEVERALLALDLTDAALEEAVERKAELVVTHHPVIFHPMASIGSDSAVYRAIAAGIAVISAHTNLDLAEGGVNDALARRLGLTKIRPLQIASERPWYKVAVFVPADRVEWVYDAMGTAGAGTLGNYSHCGFLTRGEGRFLPMEGADPAIGAVGVREEVVEIRLEMICKPEDLSGVLQAMKIAHPYEEPAYDVLETRGVVETLALGRVGVLEEPCAPRELAEHVKKKLDAAGVRYRDGGEEIKKVAVCGGSGANLLNEAKRLGAQALVTGEAKHDQWLEAGSLSMTLVDGGHFATENVVMEPLRDKLLERLPEAEILLSEACTDGVAFV